MEENKKGDYANVVLPILDEIKEAGLVGEQNGYRFTEDPWHRRVKRWVLRTFSHLFK
ncbi:MAG: hypothetical protein PHF44_02355 [Candidatus Pacebacteria bacterium]|nr:hypothetical protein [Candidatus Paceibacterota bacterium]